MESNKSKGKFFLKFAIRALILGLKEIPGVGMAVELAKEWNKVSKQLRQEQEKLDQEERLARIEAALALSPGEARQIAAEVVAEERANGTDIAVDKEAAVLDIAGAMPAVIRERTQATLRVARGQGTAPATVLPIGSLFSEAEHALREKLGDMEKRELLAFIDKQSWETEGIALRFRKLVMGE